MFFNIVYCRNNPNSKHLSIGRKKFNMDPKKVLLFVNFSWISGYCASMSSTLKCCFRGYSVVGDNICKVLW